MKSIQGAGGAVGGFGRLGPGKLELHVPVALLDGGLKQAANRMQQHGIEGQRDPLPFGRMQSDHRLAVAIVAGLDAREQQRLVAERAARLAGVIGFAEVGLRHRVLVLESKQRLARLGVRLRADARGPRGARPPRGPGMRSTGQSPPFPSTWGWHKAISCSGVSSSNDVTALTASRAATTASRSASGLMGRPGPLASRRADGSLFSATSRLAPSARARAR